MAPVIARLKRLGWAHAIYRRYTLGGARALLAGGLLAVLKRAGRFAALTRADLENGGDGIRSFPSGEAEVVVYETARTYQPSSPIPTALRSSTLDFCAAAVFEVADAELVGTTPVGFDSRGRVILETTPPSFDALHQNDHPHLPLLPLIARQLPASHALELDAAALITNPWTNNYWHWLIDALMRLPGLEDYATHAGIRPPLIVPAGLRAWQVESLAAMGHDPSEQVLWTTRRANVRRLVIPSFRRQYAGGTYRRPVSVTGCHQLRDRVFANLSVTRQTGVSFAPRVYVSRREAAFRRVVNEDQVVASLEGLGFESYTLSDMSFADQVGLFANAEVIVAPHGAGLANLIFARRPVVIELFSPYVIPLNANLARGLGFPYGYVRGTYPRFTLRGRDGHMVIDVEQVLALLRAMGIK